MNIYDSASWTTEEILRWRDSILPQIPGTFSNKDTKRSTYGVKLTLSNYVGEIPELDEKYEVCLNNDDLVILWFEPEPDMTISIYVKISNYLRGCKLDPYKSFVGSHINKNGRRYIVYLQSFVDIEPLIELFPEYEVTYTTSRNKKTITFR